MTDAVVTRLDGPPVEQEIALDMVKRSVPIFPVVVLLALAIWGWKGAASAGYGFGLVIVNFLVAAAMLAWAARISLGMLMGAALFGFLLRLGLISIAVFVVKDAAWVELVPLCLTLIITHLGLLTWETRYVSASLAFPGLKPDHKPSTYTSVYDDDDSDSTTPPEVTHP